ncbi:MAG: hypothetical protein KKF62_19390 [Bacteroidetes bacterium]|nr:hypothetical protein [Bacteroidota bacterium]
MNYELAKQLKDKGFKQKWLPDKIKPEEICGCGCNDPTLEELIEACELKADKWTLEYENGMYGMWYHGDKEYFVDGCGSPTEAVAKLWIKLQE